MSSLSSTENNTNNNSKLDIISETGLAASTPSSLSEVSTVASPSPSVEETKATLERENSKVKSCSVCYRTMQIAGTASTAVSASGLSDIAEDPFNDQLVNDVAFNSRLPPCFKTIPICLECFETNVRNGIKESFKGLCRPIKCFCGEHSIPLDVWERISPKLKAELRENYCDLAKSMMWIHCGGCGNNLSFLPDQSLSRTITKESMISQLISLAKITDTTSTPDWINKLLELLDHFEVCTSPSKKDITAISEVIKTNVTEESLIPNIIQLLRNSIYDPERRARFYLMYMRYIKAEMNSPCCGTLYCFFCKIRGGHNGLTCEEFQARKNEEDVIIMCDSCGIMLVKGDGCSSVYCVCGHYINWSDKVTLLRNQQASEGVKVLLESDLQEISLAQFALGTNFAIRPSAESDTLTLHPKLTRPIIHAWRGLNTDIVNKANNYRALVTQAAAKAGSPENLAKQWVTYIKANYYPKAKKVSEVNIAYVTFLYFRNYLELESSLEDYCGAWLANHMVDVRFSRNEFRFQINKGKYILVINKSCPIQRKLLNEKKLMNFIELSSERRHKSNKMEKSNLKREENIKSSGPVSASSDGNNMGIGNEKENYFPAASKSKRRWKKLELVNQNNKYGKQNV